MLYVAAAGPAAWWSRNHYHSPAWMDAHAGSLKLLYQYPQTRAALERYMRWWLNLPAPRSWQRQFLADKLADHRKNLDDARAELMLREAATAESAALQTRLDALNSQTSSEPVEAIGIRLRLEEIAVKWGRAGSQITPARLLWLPELEARVREAEAEVRQFDAQ